MAASWGPRPQARLLRTYGGGRRRGPGRGARARAPAAPWFSPARERRHLFSSSSSGLSAGSPGVGPGSGSISPATAPDSDSDFEPGPACGSPGAAGRTWRRRLRARTRTPDREEEEEEEEEKEEEEAAAAAAGAKENQPHRHVTERSWRLRTRSQRPGPPLCSTPGPPLARGPRSILAGLSPVRNASPAAPEPSLATSASLFSPEPSEEPRSGPARSTARKACISGLSSARWRRGRPPQVGRPPRPAAAQGGRGASGWRASLSFHQKKKVVVEQQQPPAAPRSPPPLDATWQASSMYALTPNTSLAGEEAQLSDAQKVYRECQQDGPLAFGHYLGPSLQSCEKIGEGVFGEVFRTVVDGRSTALKVIAIEGEALVNGSPQKTFAEILPEIIISKELSLLAEEASNRTDGFIGLYGARCVQGAYPDVLLRAWDAFRRSRGSENERPDCFGQEQLYVVLEFEFGGMDLEHMHKQLSSVAVAKSLLHQVTAALAVAEAALHFEHRDLHWGNVLVKRTSAKELGYTLNGQPGTIATHGIHVNIIDYTLSRLEKDGLVVFCDISQERELFQGQGDYQFEIYRLMKKRTRNRWAHYHPYSNVLWLHYLADKVLKEMAFKKATRAPMRRVRQQIQAFHESVLGFDSATELLQGHSLFQ
ncbi:serine/threonine-protein kinase haspin [Petaurus breviceps papuanus]|uniref:serine/threonine-protein kinase haspin n=1 Tax=Petaurus breviceps papuanus TaxID=3040969 RepID=UPI0036D920BB